MEIRGTNNPFQIFSSLKFSLFSKRPPVDNLLFLEFRGVEHFKLCDKKQQTWRFVFERNVKFCPIIPSNIHTRHSRVSR